MYLRFANIHLVYLAFNLNFNCSQASLQHVWEICIAGLVHIRDCLQFHFMILQKFHRLQSVDLAMTLRLFDFSLCSLLLQILMLYLNNILLFSYIQTNFHIKLTGFPKCKVTFQWAVTQKVYGSLKVFVPHPNLRQWERKLFASRNWPYWDLFVNSINFFSRQL